VPYPKSNDPISEQQLYSPILPFFFRPNEWKNWTFFFLSLFFSRISECDNYNTLRSWKALILYSSLAYPRNRNYHFPPGISTTINPRISTSNNEMSGTRELGAQPKWSSCSLITFSPGTKNKLKISILSSDCTQLNFFCFLESHGRSINSISLRILIRPLSTTSWRRERKKRSGSLRARNRSSRASWKQYRSFLGLNLRIYTERLTRKESQ